MNLPERNILLEEVTVWKGMNSYITFIKPQKGVILWDPRREIYIPAKILTKKKS